MNDSSEHSTPEHVPVLIAGGGPVGLTLAALLARQGISSQVIEADEGYCSGSRAICISRRSQEILGWVGADAALVDKGLGWTAGRSHFRQAEVLRFDMPSEPTQRFAPMVNIQQFYVEQYAHEAIGAGADVRWGERVQRVQPLAEGVAVDIQTPQGLRRVRADWLLACDGGRSTVREQLGLQLEGTQYEGRYVIVDIRQKTRRPVERLAWFDPPSNPGSTILMHRQPDDVWRIDYQVRDDEDPVEAVKPENVLPRVRSHLEMIGETEPWEALWISIYNAKCLTLADYRHGRVLFAGDAAHLVPIFGVRGLNSGLDDAGNLAWKLARVQRGESPEALLDSYSTERLHATRENIAYGAKSTEFMAPPDFGFRLMREAALRLAQDDPAVRPLINPRQSSAIHYRGSPLNAGESPGWRDAAAAPGAPAPEALLRGDDGQAFHLSSRLGQHFLVLAFNGRPEGPLPDGLRCLRIDPANDPHAQAWQRYGLSEPGQQALVLLRPDGYVMGRWHGLDGSVLQQALNTTGVSA